VWYSNTQNDFSSGAAIFSLHTLASPSGRNVNYDEKQLSGGKKVLIYSFYLYRFRKYVTYDFPIINFCNPGVHYETPCIYCEIPVLLTLCINRLPVVLDIHSDYPPKKFNQLLFKIGSLFWIIGCEIFSTTQIKLRVLILKISI